MMTHDPSPASPFNRPVSADGADRSDIVHPTGEVLTAKGRRTRQHIVEVAAIRIHERGVAATTLDDVRVAAGVSSSQLYHYFADKQALIHAVVDAQVVAVIGRVAEAGLDSAAGFRDWRDAVVRNLDQSGPQGGCPIGSLASALTESDGTARLALADGFARWEMTFRDGLLAMADRGELPDGADPRALAATLLAVVQGGYLLAQVQRDARPMAVALDTVLRLITGPGPAA